MVFTCLQVYSPSLTPPLFEKGGPTPWICITLDCSCRARAKPNCPEHHRRANVESSLQWTSGKTLASPCVEDGNVPVTIETNVNDYFVLQPLTPATRDRSSVVCVVERDWFPRTVVEMDTYRYSGMSRDVKMWCEQTSPRKNVVWRVVAQVDVPFLVASVFRLSHFSVLTPP